MTDVRIGERNIAVPRFTGFKITRAMRLIATIAKAYPDALKDAGDFKRAYEQANAMRVTQDMAKMPRFAAWKLKPSDFAEKGYIEIPTAPSFRELMTAVGPQILDAAEKPVLELLALAVSPNNELAEADMNGGDDAIDEYLKLASKRLLHEANFEDLISIAGVAFAVIQEQVAAKGDELGNLVGLFSGQSNSPTTTSSNGNGASAPHSSTDSDAPTGGDDVKSSSKSTG